MEPVITEIPAKESKKVIRIAEDIGDYAFEDIAKLDFEVFVYSYENGGYDGSGIAVWKKGDKFFYHELGHCSCNGPVENIESSANVGHSLEEVEELVRKNYSWDTHGEKVIAEIKKYA